MTQPEQEITYTARSIAPHMARGAAWMVGMRWCVRGLGLVSTVILARLLTPDDFGVIAMAMLFVGLLEILLETGVDQVVIRLQNPAREDYDSAWTIQVLVGAALSLATFLAAPIVARFFGVPALELVVQVLALRAIALGLVNIGVVNFRRDLDFAKEFRFSVYKKVVGLAVTIIAAPFLLNYWALVLGMVVGPWLVVLLSYTMQPFRPRLSLARLSALWRFSGWLLLVNVTDFFRRKFDVLVVGRISGTAPLANYTMASDVAVLPTVELLWPIGRALLPTYTKLIGQPAELARAYVGTLRFMAMLALPVGAGLSALSDEIVLVLLGEQWTAAGPLVAWFGIAGALMGVTGAIHPFLVALGYVRQYAWLVLAEVTVFVPVVIVAGIHGGVEAVAIARVGVLVLSVPAFLVLSTFGAPVRVAEIAGAMVRPLLASAAMYAGVVSLPLEGVEAAAARLALGVASGVVLYVTAVLALWLGAGRPDGAERLIFDRLTAGLARKSRI